VAGLVEHGKRFAQAPAWWQSRCFGPEKTRGAVARSLGSDLSLEAASFEIAEH